MAGWRDRLVPASYRGVSFLVDSYEWSGSRRALVAEFPQREEIYVEDLGRKVPVHRIEAIVLGDDYAERRDQLYRVLSRKGDGFPGRQGSVLRHQYLGDVEVLPLAW